MNVLGPGLLDNPIQDEMKSNLQQGLSEMIGWIPKTYQGCPCLDLLILPNIPYCITTLQSVHRAWGHRYRPGDVCIAHATEEYRNS
jgi:hypothetical protein